MKRYIVMAVLMFLASVVHGAEVPIYEEYEVDVEVAYDSASGVYEYGYTLTNPEGNKNDLSSLEISIPKDLSAKELSWEGLTYGKWHISEYVKNKVVAVGIVSPEGWFYGIGYDVEGKGLVGSGSLEDHEIQPGDSLKAMTLTSFGIPAIRDAELSPAIDYDNLPDEYYGNVELAKQLKDNLLFKTRTVGPTAPPRELDPAGFLEGIIEMKHEAYSLGWITSQSIEQSLDVKLDGALKKLGAGNGKAAGNILRAFINEVEAQGCETYEDCPKGKHLRPEAYALLKYNAQYLLDNLK